MDKRRQGRVCDDLEDYCACFTLRSHLKRTSNTWAHDTFGRCAHIRHTSQMVSVAEFAFAESYAARKLGMLKACGINLSSEGLTPHQYEQLSKILHHPASVLTGGPGTGKSYAVGKLVSSAQAQGFRVLLLAPTGVAAKRLSEATGQSASTMHKALGFKRGEFTVRDLPCDLCVMDEGSMVGAFLNAKVLQALPAECQVIYVGDSEQLPSVDPGNVMQDLTESLPVARLTETVRYKKEGDISEAAKAILGNDPSELRLWEAGAEEATKAYKAFARKGSVFCCTLRNEDVDKINAALHSQNRGSFPVMCVQNCYDLELFNGETGRTDGKGNFWWDDGRKMALDPIDYDGAFAYYNSGGRYPLKLRQSYCCTVHKSQGRTVDRVIIYLPKGATMDVTLLYTAVTRAREEYIIVGDKETLARSLNRQHRRRLTLLAPCVRGELEIPPDNIEIRY